MDRSHHSSLSCLRPSVPAWAMGLWVSLQGPQLRLPPSCPSPSPPPPPDLLPSCLGQFYSNGGHSGNAGGGGGGGGGGSSGYGSYYQGDNYNSPVPPKHAGKKQPHGGQQKPSYGSGYQPHQGQQQSYSQSQYSNYGPPQGKQKGYNHGQGNYSSYSNSYGSPGGGGGSDYSYESKFSELAGRAHPQAWWRAERCWLQGRHQEDPGNESPSLSLCCPLPVAFSTVPEAGSPE